MPAIVLQSSLKPRELNFHVCHFFYLAQTIFAQAILYFLTFYKIIIIYVTIIFLRIIHVCIIQYTEDMSFWEEQADSSDNT